MWRNPNYPAPEPVSPPEERGERVGTIARGQDEKLRIAIDEFRGHRYLALRAWSRDRDGNFWPLKGKGVSVRLSELREVIEALQRAEELTSQDASVKRGSARPSGGSLAHNPYRGRSNDIDD
jgi:Transcriptional Coactivator p15 (PC4)